VFGDDAQPRPFDMSEFSAEHAADRLIGAPPGYVGHEAGGELTDAVRRNPFLVLLFDEIEKAHPRILDKFLQILDEGRLTDGRGHTVYFSEAFLVFTSNLGMMRRVTRRGEDGSTITSLEPNVTPDMDAAEVERRILEAIDDTFERELNRPELRNRFGDNIVVFQFIGEEAAGRILDKFLDQVARRLLSETGRELSLSSHARGQLERICFEDLTRGGRGIGNRLETALINPLARALFHWSGSGAIRVEAIVDQGSGLFSVELSPASSGRSQ
jgi:ATP-dependent Clp protease ATP-binding subunit ClpA